MRRENTDAMTEPRVEAGDRALETARKIHAKCYLWARTPIHNITSAEQIAEIAAEVQSAMNAQERELREALRQGRMLVAMLASFVHCGESMDAKSASEIAAFQSEASRLLAERGR